MTDIKRKALKETAKTLAGLTLISLAVPAIIFTVPLQIIGLAFSVGALVFATKLIYDTKLGQIQARERLEQMTENNPTLR